MTEVRDLSCPLMTKVLLHTYNKNRAPVQGADGKLSASKLKNTGTAKALAIRYGLIVQPQFLKNNVRELTNRCNEAAWQEEDKEYDSDSMKNALMSRYPTAIPGSVRINAKGGSATVLGAPAAPSSVVSAGDLHIGRQLQLIHGALIDIGADLRLLSGRATAGSRGKVSAAASFLLNGTAEEDESDDDETTTKTKKGRAVAAAKKRKGPPSPESSSSSSSSSSSDSEDSSDDEEAEEEGEAPVPMDGIAAEMTAAAGAPSKRSKTAAAKSPKASAAASPAAASGRGSKLGGRR